MNGGNIQGRVVVITGASSALREAADRHLSGLMPHSPLERLKVDDRDRMIDVNIKGVLYGISGAAVYDAARPMTV